MDIKVKLGELGFKYIGNWSKTEDNKLFYKLNQLSKIDSILYAFIMGDELLYIGKTTRNIENRLKGYINPGSSQTTNIKNNANLIELLNLNNNIQIWIFEDNGLMSFGGFRVNLAAGLEDSLIKELKPKWNGNRLSIEYNKLIEQFEDVYEKKEKPIYRLKLCKTYYNWECINISSIFSEFLGEHEQKIGIFIGTSKNQLETAKIDRNATPNSTIRIRPDGSKNLKKWFHDNCELNEVIDILIESPNKIRIIKIQS